MSPRQSCRVGVLRRLGAITASLAATLGATGANAVLAVPAADAVPARADPLDPRAPTTAPAHRSPLQSYRRLPEVPPPEGARWREGNETVNRIGGWRAYAREATAAAAAASAPAGERP